ncbi:hypothetical protein AAXE64_07450 [Priestia megaterium]
MRETFLKGKEGSPDCTVVEINEPNFLLMAKAFVTLYEELKRNGKLEKVLKL